MSIIQTLGAVTLIYILIGALLGVIWFTIAKVIELDDKSDHWDLVLNSALGLVYFFIVISLFWLPAIFPYIKKTKSLFKKESTIKDKNILSKGAFLKPVHSLKELFFDWYFLR